MTHFMYRAFHRARPAVLGVALAFLVFAPATAQTLRIGFAAPTDAMVAEFGAANVFGLDVDGYRGAWVTSANVAHFRALAPDNLERTYDQLQTGTTLRTRVDRLFRVSGGRVDVDLYLVDDSSHLNGTADDNPGCATDYDDAGDLYVWPAAGNSPSGPDRWRGEICLGEWSSGHIQVEFPGGWQAWESTILHEMFHTQFVGEHSKWGVANGRLITYGFDGSHWTSEILGEQELPFEEGFGSFLGDLLNPDGRADTTNFFTRDDHRYSLEGQSVSAGYEELYRAPRERREIEVDAPDGSTANETVWDYKWKDVPGRYLLFSESTSMGYHQFFWEKVNNDPDQALEMIYNEVGAMWNERGKRYLTYGANRLALQMEAHAATPAGQAARRAGTLTSSMFPYALLDIVTHFGMTEAQFKADHDRHYPDRNPRAYTEYWAHREHVQRTVQPHLDDSPIDIANAVAVAHRLMQTDAMILTPAP